MPTNNVTEKCKSTSAPLRSGIPMTEAMFYVLLTLGKERHGYSIMKEISSMTSGRLHPGSGTVYGLLPRLENEGLIRMTFTDGKKRRYIITEAGRTLLEQEYRRICEMYSNGSKLRPQI